MKKPCERILATLTPSEEIGLRFHFGIGRTLGCTLPEDPERIRHIRAQASRKLRLRGCVISMVPCCRDGEHPVENLRTPLYLLLSRNTYEITD